MRRFSEALACWSFFAADADPKPDPEARQNHFVTESFFMKSGRKGPENQHVRRVTGSIIFSQFNDSVINDFVMVVPIALLGSFPEML